MNKEKVTNVILAAVAMVGVGSIAVTIYETKLSKQLDKDCIEMYDKARNLVSFYEVLYTIMSYDEEAQDTEQV